MQLKKIEEKNALPIKASILYILKRQRRPFCYFYLCINRVLTDLNVVFTQDS